MTKVESQARDVFSTSFRFGSVCSGIEAASVAWEPLGWRAAWLSEIEPFPSAVLAHHYPNVPNLGDMTTLPERISSGEVEAPDLFCGGTPCQAFSVAGLRKSLDDARGNLSLTFCEIANAIDTRRAGDSQPPAIIFWENVPGVLSTKDNAFGCFLAGLAGEDDPIVAPRGKWTNAGVVLGPQRAVAWRVLDAQYFGVAQRRRRVFVVASARNDFDPAAVLFEFDGLRRDSAPSRQAGQEAARSAGEGATFSCAGIGAYTNDNAAATLLKSGQDLGNWCEALISQPISIHPHCIGRAPDAGPQGKEYLLDGSAYCMDSRGQPQAVVQTFDFQSSGEYGTAPVAATLSARDYKSAKDLAVQPIAFHPTQDPISSTDGSTHGLGTGNRQGCATVAIAFSAKDYGGDATADLSPTLRAMGHADSHANGGGQMAVAVSLRGREGGATAELGDEVQNCLRASQGGGDKPHVLAPVAYTTKLHNTQSNNAGKLFEERSPCLDANSPAPALLTAMAVRRLTPVECERLQGFPDTYTQIPWRTKPASDCPDGPRYKALGNSWAVPVVRWIGRRIALSVAISASGGVR